MYCLKHEQHIVYIQVVYIHFENAAFINLLLVYIEKKQNIFLSSCYVA